jgi:hypothetical protein
MAAGAHRWSIGSVRRGASCRSVICWRSSIRLITPQLSRSPSLCSALAKTREGCLNLIAGPGDFAAHARIGGQLHHRQEEVAMVVNTTVDAVEQVQLLRCVIA